jgi:hypothetical protein
MKKRTVFGLPLNPVRHLSEIDGASFCVSYATRDKLGGQLDDAIAAVGPEEIMLVDNGAFSAWRSGQPMDVEGFARWAADILARCPQAVAVVPDVIDGTAEDNDAMLIDFYGVCWQANVDIDSDRMMAVWHMHEPLHRLTGLIEGGYQYIAIGSSGEYAQPGTDSWHNRIREAFAAIDQFIAEGEGAWRRPWLHMMRAQAEAHRYDFDSADSCNLAVNHGRYRAEGPGHVGRLAARITAKIDASCDGIERPTIRPPLEEVTEANEFRDNLAALCGHAQPAAAPGPARQLTMFAEMAAPAAAEWKGCRPILGQNTEWHNPAMPGIVIRRVVAGPVSYPYWRRVDGIDTNDTLGTFHYLYQVKAAANRVAAGGLEAAIAYEHNGAPTHAA